MTAVDLNQFASLFEIGFALHLAVAFLDRIYARELPERIDRITGRAKALEQLRSELTGRDGDDRGDLTAELRFNHRIVTDPLWTRHNDHLLDRVYALRQDASSQMKTLKRIITLLTSFSILVALYSVAVLFVIGLGLELAKGIDPIVASVIVLLQLLPLPIAAAIVFLVVRRMSHEIDRKLRGIGELQLMLNPPGSAPASGYVSVDQVYRRSRARLGFSDDS